MSSVIALFRKRRCRSEENQNLGTEIDAAPFLADTGGSSKNESPHRTNIIESRECTDIIVRKAHQDLWMTKLSISSLIRRAHLRFMR